MTPNLLDNKILVDPFPITIELGSQLIKFRLAAPRDMLLKTYYITWSKTGDSYPVTYAPLRRTKINLVIGTLKRIVS